MAGVAWASTLARAVRIEHGQGYLPMPSQERFLKTGSSTVASPGKLDTAWRTDRINRAVFGAAAAFISSADGPHAHGGRERPSRSGRLAFHAQLKTNTTAGHPRPRSPP